MARHTRTPPRAARLRALNQPVPVAVQLDARGLPEAVRGTDRERKGTRGSGTASRRVAEVLETWRIDDEWWRRPIRRRYAEVVLEGGTHVVLFEDLVTGEWFLQNP